MQVLIKVDAKRHYSRGEKVTPSIEKKKVKLFFTNNTNKRSRLTIF